MYYLVCGRVLVKEKDLDDFVFQYVDKIARVAEADNPNCAAAKALNDYLVESKCTGVWVGCPDVAEVTARRLEQMRAAGVEL